MTEAEPVVVAEEEVAERAEEVVEEEAEAAEAEEEGWRVVYRQNYPDLRQYQRSGRRYR